MYLIVLILILINAPVFAARPLVTDDASTMGAGACQFESWTQRNKQSTEFWALPTCGVSNSLDITIGGGYSTTGKTDYIFQIKNLLQPITTNGMGVGLVSGAVAHPEITRNANQIANYYSYIPISFSLLNDQLLIHSNIGWHYDKDIKEHNAMWGIGFEIPFNSRWSGVGETYGDYRKDTYWQLGLRYAVIPDVFQIDSSIGGLLIHPKEERWISLGFHWVFDKLF